MLKKKNLALVTSIVMASVMTFSGCTPAGSTTAATTEPAAASTTPAPTTAAAANASEAAPAKAEEEIPVLDRSAEGTNGAVASGKLWASDIGVDILKQGGNAIDAAVAVGFAIGAFEPNANGLGGGGFMMIRLADGTTSYIDFRETAPAAAAADMYPLNEEKKVIDNLNMKGGLASGVPGETAGLLLALDTYGTMTPAQVLQPSIDALNEGIPVTVHLSNAIKDSYEYFITYEGGQNIYLDEDGLPHEPGATYKNEELANTLSTIAEQGRDGFYQGEVAQAIVDTVQKWGGIITMEDMANYEAKIREPISGTYKEYTILSASPPSSGGAIMIELLNIMENFDLSSWTYDSADTLHAWAEAMKLVYADRAKYMADPDYVDVPLNGLTNKDYAKTLFEQIDMSAAAQNVEAGNPWEYDSENTTHYSVMDKDGNMVSVTKSINSFFGSGVVVPGTGIIMNNHMADFATTPGQANSIEANKRPLSSMSPAIILKDNHPYMVIGSPGGTRIITAVATTFSKIVDHNMELQDAINSPRIFTTHTSSLSVEGDRFPEETIKELENRGHEIDKGASGYNPSFGSVQTVILTDEGVYMAGGDPRRDGQGSAY